MTPGGIPRKICLSHIILRLAQAACAAGRQLSYLSSRSERRNRLLLLPSGEHIILLGVLHLPNGAQEQHLRNDYSDPTPSSPTQTLLNPPTQCWPDSSNEIIGGGALRIQVDNTAVADLLNGQAMLRDMSMYPPLMRTAQTISELLQGGWRLGSITDPLVSWKPRNYHNATMRMFA